MPFYEKVISIITFAILLFAGVSLIKIKSIEKILNRETATHYGYAALFLALLALLMILTKWSDPNASIFIK